MAFRVIVSPRAEQQLRAIERYVAEAADPQTAEKLIDRLLKRCGAVLMAPHGGTPRPELGKGLRSVPFEACATILYRVRGEEVIIAAVFYRGQDIGARMRRPRR